MFLIFALGRPDVLSVGDLGIRVGLRSFYGLDELPTPQECRALTEGLAALPDDRHVVSLGADRQTFREEWVVGSG